MSNIEPTEEQRQAALAFLMDDCVDGIVEADGIAQLLADREHALRSKYDENDMALRVECSDLEHERDALREQVAKLEAQAVRDDIDHWTLMGRERVLQEREAQHLADIATLRAACDSALFSNHVDNNETQMSQRSDWVCRAALAATAHYDKPSNA